MAMEWQIVTVIIVLLGLIVTVTTPLLKLSNTITKLNQTCENLEVQFKEFEISNKDGHKRIWAHNDKQDERLNNHENRIYILEEEKKHEKN